MRCNHEKLKIVLWVKKPQKRPKTRLKTNQQPRFQCFSEDVSENLFKDHRNAEDACLSCRGLTSRSFAEAVRLGGGFGLFFPHLTGYVATNAFHRRVCRWD
jgi:hypothetical protein